MYIEGSPQSLDRVIAMMASEQKYVKLLSDRLNFTSHNAI